MADPRMDDRPVGGLVQEMSQQTAALVRKELELAQLEMKEEGKRAGIGAGLFGRRRSGRLLRRGRSDSPAAPEQAIASTKRDVDEIKRKAGNA